MCTLFSVCFSWRSAIELLGHKQPSAYFGLCGSHFCGKEVFDHKEHYIFTILFFPGLERGLEPDRYRLSVTRNFPFSGKHVIVLVFCLSFCNTSCELCFVARGTFSCCNCLLVKKGRSGATLSSLGDTSMHLHHLS